MGYFSYHQQKKRQTSSRPETRLMTSGQASPQVPHVKDPHQPDQNEQSSWSFANIRITPSDNTARDTNGTEQARTTESETKQISSHANQTPPTIQRRSEPSNWSFTRIAIAHNEPGSATDEPEMQKSSSQGNPLEDKAQTSRQKNSTGLPDNLKTGVEHLSGLSLDDVQVHYNSSRPAQVGALAYTQGTNIYIGSGQEQHLAHETWHAVQQKQERVKPTMHTHGISINDEKTLEHEADTMGARAKTWPSTHALQPSLQAMAHHRRSYNNNSQTVTTPLQLMKTEEYNSLATMYKAERVNEMLALTGKSQDIATMEEIEGLLKMQHTEPENHSYTAWLHNGQKTPTGMNCWEFVIYIAVTKSLLEREKADRAYEKLLNNFHTIFSDGELIVSTAQLSPGDAIVLDNPEIHTLISLGGNTVADLGTMNMPVLTTLQNVEERWNTPLYTTKMTGIIGDRVKMWINEKWTGNDNEIYIDTVYNMLNDFSEKEEDVYGNALKYSNAIKKYLRSNSVPEDVIIPLTTYIIVDLISPGRQLYRLKLNDWVNKINALQS